MLAQCFIGTAFNQISKYESHYEGEKWQNEDVSNRQSQEEEFSFDTGCERIGKANCRESQGSQPHVGGSVYTYLTSSSIANTYLLWSLPMAALFIIAYFVTYEVMVWLSSPQLMDF